ncbi:MAG TPA: hypothetical protein VFG62_13840 [Rhodopila sp.]|jgi:hypothetical protein|nr:hypothetical protein [Rhodopila sp.]
MPGQTATAPTPPNMTEAGEFTAHPSDLLIELIAALLTPMFLGATRGDPRLARLAALETVYAYRVVSQADLLNVLQMIALGLASAQAACLSLTPDLPLAQVMRLLGHADRLNRSGMARSRFREQERLSLGGQTSRLVAVKATSRTDASKEPPRPATKPEAPAPKAPDLEVRKPAPTPITATPAPRLTAQIPAQPSVAFAHLTELQQSAHAFDPIAQPAQARQAATLRAKALNGIAHDLLAGTPMSPVPFKLSGNLAQR